jgi:nitrite reductase (NO-forming)
VTNAGTMQHDLRLSNGVQTPMLDPGEKATLDAGVIGKDLDGWCTVPGHRAAGMAMTITATPATGTSGQPSPPPMADMPGMGTGTSKAPPPDWKPVDPTLAPLPAGTTVHKVTWHMRDVTMSVAPGVTQQMWTFDGTVPGPVLHGRVGDTFEVTVVNDTAMPHNIDFHAESGPPAKVMQAVQPGGKTAYRFTATHAGAWLYHCGVEPMLLHLGNGMYGALIVEPPDLAPVAQQYVLVGSEFFFGPQGGIGDYQKMLADNPDAMAFNGYPFAYQYRPIAAPVGKTVRVWVIDAGPSRALSFHVVGAPFTSVFLDGGYLVRPGDPARGAGQSLPVMPGDGGFVELSFTQAGDYPFMTHVLADAAKGASGVFRAS